MEGATTTMEGALLRTLVSQDLLRLLTDEVDEDDALALALTCRALRDAVFARFEPCAGEDGARIRSRVAANVSSEARLGWARALGCPCACYWAARVGARDTLRLCRTLATPGAECSASGAMLGAARAGDASLIRWLHNQQQCAPTREAGVAAAANGHVGALEALHAIGLAWNSLISAAAAGGGHLTLCDWLRSRGCPFSPWAATSAARNGHLDVLQWLAACKYRLGVGDGCIPTTNAAAEHGSAELLSWLRQNGCGWDGATAEALAAGGHLETLQWARAHGPVPWDRRAAAAAAAANHRHVLEWGCAHGMPWGADTCAAAAVCGHLELLVWLRERGCPWDYETIAEAERAGHARVAEWACAHGCPRPAGTYQTPELWGGLGAAVQRLLRDDEESDDASSSGGED